MPKLQKRSISLDPVESSPRYESFSSDTKQPIPITPDSPPTGLMSNNPWAHHSSTFSPVSPLDTMINHTMTAQINERPSSSHSSVDVRRLDGTPNPAGERQVKVAQDMHAGAVPPAYGPAPIGSPHDDSKGCSKPNCNKCGKRKSENTSPAPIRAPIPPPQSVAGPSSLPLRKCHKCGKHKRPMVAAIPTPPQPTFGAQHRFSSQSTIVPQPRPQQPSLSLVAGDNLPKPGIPQVDIIPPSASTYRPRVSTVSTFHDEAPLVKQTQQQEYKPSRTESLIRSLSRRSSNKNRSGPPTPGSDKGEQNSGGLMGLIRNHSTRRYNKLGADEPNSRPASPFSFMETPNDNAFELKNMDDGDSDGTRSPSIKSPTQERLSVTRPPMPKSASAPAEGDLMLAIPEHGGENRPQLTRFKSLRSGVTRAASTVSRSNSLKRLGSISKAWERNDMSLDAYQGEGNAVSAY